MNPTATSHDDLLRADFDALTRSTTRASHPAEHEWVSFATGSLNASERERVSNHLVSCAECAAVYRAVTHVRLDASTFDAGAPRPGGSTKSLSSRAFVAQVLAASLLIVSAGLLAWSLRLQQRTAELERQINGAARPAVPRAADTPAPVAQPQIPVHINVPIIHLQPSLARGAQSRSQTIEIPPEADLLTLIVNTDAPRRSGAYSLALLDSSGATTWSSGGLKPAPDGTLSVALSTTLLRPGEYVFVLAETAGGRTVHRYSITAASR